MKSYVKYILYPKILGITTLSLYIKPLKLKKTDKI